MRQDTRGWGLFTFGMMERQKVNGPHPLVSCLMDRRTRGRRRGFSSLKNLSPPFTYWPTNNRTKPAKDWGSIIKAWLTFSKISTDICMHACTHTNISSRNNDRSTHWSHDFQIQNWVIELIPSSIPNAIRYKSCSTKFEIKGWWLKTISCVQVFLPIF